jgi:hypothetical protein
LKKLLALLILAALPALADWSAPVTVINAVGGTTAARYKRQTPNATSVLIQITSASTSSATVTIEQSVDGAVWTPSAAVVNPTSVGELWACPAAPWMALNLAPHASGTITAVVSQRLLAGDPVGDSCRKLFAPANTFGALSVTSLADTALTQGRIPYAGSGGLMTDSAALTVNGAGAVTAFNLNENTSTHNFAVGQDSLNRTGVTGTDNLAFGAFILPALSAGYMNIGIGSNALHTIHDGSGNIGIGFWAGRLINSANFNTAVGYNSLIDGTAEGNTVLGALAGYTSGASPSSGNSVTTGAHNTFVGYQSGLGSSTQRSNSSAFGNGAFVSADNQVVLGNGSVTEVQMGAGGVAKVTATGIQLMTGIRPTCDEAHRGTTWYVAGGAGSADTYEVCGKSVADTYSWVTSATF